MNIVCALFWFTGLLRDNWIHKHRELLPSVAILVTTFSVEWSSSEWMRREASFFDRYTRLKNALAGRDVKIVLLPVRVGAAQASIDKVCIYFCRAVFMFVNCRYNISFNAKTISVIYSA